MSTNNPPTITLELDIKLAEFLLLNSTVNIRMNLAAMQNMKSKDLISKLIEYTEMFKLIKNKLEIQGIKLRE